MGRRRTGENDVPRSKRGAEVSVPDIPADLTGFEATPGQTLRLPHWDPLLLSKLRELEAGDLAAGRSERFADPHRVLSSVQLRGRLFGGGGEVYAMALAPSGDVVAACSVGGIVRLWHTETLELLAELHDEAEMNIEEFYCLAFSPDERRLFAAGKRKLRNKWCDEDDDNEVAPGPIKVFDLETLQICGELCGHREEILCLRTIQYRNENYLLSCSQDGYVIKWALEKDWKTLCFKVRIDPVTTSMALDATFLPGCGSRYFVVAADDGLKVYDFEAEVLLQSFPGLYSCYCDCVLSVSLAHMPGSEWAVFLLTRGVEMLDPEQDEAPIRANSVILYKLKLPNEFVCAIDAFQLTEIARFQHSDYQANGWPLRMAATGRQMFLPTSTGRVLIANVETGELDTVLSDHAPGGEVRCVLVHPWRPWIYTCADDGHLAVYECHSETKHPDRVSAASDSAWDPVADMHTFRQGLREDISRWNSLKLDVSAASNHLVQEYVRMRQEWNRLTQAQDQCVQLQRRIEAESKRLELARERSRNRISSRRAAVSRPRLRPARTSLDEDEDHESLNDHEESNIQEENVQIFE